MFAVDPQRPLTRPALAVELTDLIRGLILEGELRPGEKVPEKALTLRFGVSRTPVREALKVLAAEGYVRLVPNRGAVVAEPTLAELEEVFPVIAALEGAAGELAAERAGDAEIAEVRRLNDAMHAAYRSGDRPRYFELNQQIHAAILAAARNPTLRQQHKLVADRVRWARYQANLAAARWQAALDEHDAIIAALEAREGERLGRLMKSHLEHKLEALRGALGGEER
ncbi:transcriptional regulator, GntR family [Tistlia consotensis]|uniref:Transcriptional regulator, GntR family n=1 Tax=Tistlia consotensis USBA 355 TaxID=560819 RepID=A0A1Y6B977_9PROT|nr:GntR family transcriptional regulator [Tistlia consotensis]SME92234.1 transcriptional regulator, GntR family [Tistlia consotensis USBA 355]SNR27910.1 transcriptional regulator, GntR family [Tistlia consotensis]